jgi:hypothetical protein
MLIAKRQIQSPRHSQKMSGFMTIEYHLLYAMKPPKDDWQAQSLGITILYIHVCL